MNYSTLTEAMEQVGLRQGWEIDAWSVYRAFEQVADGRHKRGVRYHLAWILTLIVLGKLAGMTSLLGIAQWVRLRADWLREIFPSTRKSFPCAATVSQYPASSRCRAGEPGPSRLAHTSSGQQTL